VTVLSLGMALMRHWLPDMGATPRARVRTRGTLAIDFRGAVAIARSEGDRIEASITGRIDRVGPEPGSVETCVDARRRSSGAVADANPFLWFQLVDDRGTALSHETFLGRGVGIERKVQARVHLAAAGTRLVSGLHARIVARTYCNTTGPRHHVETLMLTLLAAGAEFVSAAISKVPVLTVVPGRPGTPAPITLAEVGSV
jgi:hypothetical protein